MRNVRTDLVYETVNNIGTGISGVSSVDAVFGNIKVNRISISSKSAADKIGRRIGNYTTIFCPDLCRVSGKGLIELVNCISSELLLLLKNNDKKVMVVGLGNTLVTPDALGPSTVKNIIVSRHLKRDMKSLYSSLELGDMAAIAPGVLGQTGVESAEIIKAVAEKVSPDALIVIDSLLSGKAERLATTVQLSDSGIIPGSGLNNNRFEISSNTMDIPVVTVGVPVVIDAKTLAFDLADSLCTGNKSKKIIEKSLSPFEDALVVTPKHIDSIVEKAGRILGFSINRAIHKKLSIEDMNSLLS